MDRVRLGGLKSALQTKLFYSCMPTPRNIGLILAFHFLQITLLHLPDLDSLGFAIFKSKQRTLEENSTVTQCLKNLWFASRLQAMEMSGSVCLSPGSRMVFALITAIAHSLASKLVNMDCQSANSKACWHRDLTLLKFPWLKEGNTITGMIEMNETAAQSECQFIVECHEIWWYQHDLSTVGCFLLWNFLASWIRSPPRTEFSLPPRWQDCKDALKRNWQLSRTCSRVSWLKRALNVKELCIDNNQALDLCFELLVAFQQGCSNHNQFCELVILFQDVCSAFLRPILYSLKSVVSCSFSLSSA